MGQGEKPSIQRIREQLGTGSPKPPQGLADHPGAGCLPAELAV
ncbi:MAG: hypothetical protein ABN479_09310 [Billgrantia sp.]